jgi:glycerate dehydrogenase
MEACKRRGIKVVSLLDDRKGLDTITASSEFTFKLILDALRIAPARELIGKGIGLVGYGRIGKNVERYCGAFGARVRYVCDPYVGRYDSLEWVFSHSDIVVICCSLTSETRGIIGRKLLRSMKEGAVLVNTARGEVIRENELAEVMKDRQDLRVALDVLTGETTGTQKPAPLLALGAIITPHIAGETFDSRTKAAKIILRLLKGMI